MDAREYGVLPSNSNNFSALQTAFNAATTAGAILRLPAGTLNYSNPSNTSWLTAGCSIIGEGQDTILRNTKAQGRDGTIYVANRNRIAFRNFAMQHANPATVADDPREQDGGINIYGTQRLAVQGVWFLDMFGTPLLLRLCTDFQIIGNMWANVVKDSCHMTHACRNGTVMGNVFQDVGDDAIAMIGYNTDGAGNKPRWITVSGNTINGSKAGRGIAVSGGADITIANNVITNPRYSGIYIHSESSGSWNTQSVEDVVVYGNQLYGCGSDNAFAVNGGISLGTGAAGMSRITVRDNVVKASAYRGIHCFGFSGVIIDRLVIEGNTIEGTTDELNKEGTGTNKQYTGISVDGYVRDLTLRGNNIRRTGGHGVYVGPTCDGRLEFGTNYFADINLFGVANDCLHIAASSAASIIEIGPQVQRGTAGNHERVIECENPSITRWLSGTLSDEGFYASGMTQPTTNPAHTDAGGGNRTATVVNPYWMPTVFQIAVTGATSGTVQLRSNAGGFTPTISKIDSAGNAYVLVPPKWSAIITFPGNVATVLTVTTTPMWQQ